MARYLSMSSSHDAIDKSSWFQTGLVGLLFSGLLLSEDSPIFRAAELGPRDEPRIATPDLLPN